MEFYHEGMRSLQDRYEGREVADRIQDHRVHGEFEDADRALVESAAFFFLATASEENVDCSFKGGTPGFVRVACPKTLEWPDYDGNRMYRSLGNINHNPLVGMLFFRFDGHLYDGYAARLRINGRAEIDDSPDAIKHLPGAKRLVRVCVEHIFPNCPRYIPTMELLSLSEYAPREDHTPPDPQWKNRPMVKDIFDKENDRS